MFCFLILISLVVVVFILGIWVSYYSVLVWNLILGKWVEIVIGKERVVKYIKVVNLKDFMVILMFGGDVNLFNLVKKDNKLFFVKMDEYWVADLLIVNLENFLICFIFNNIN